MAHRPYWFKPKRFWGVFAAYYPVTGAGWLTTILLAAVAVAIFLHADARSHSVSDTLIGAAPGLIIVFLIFDLITFRTGEYPSWWPRFGGEHHGR
jgi:hypothetical protein